MMPSGTTASASSSSLGQNPAGRFHGCENGNGAESVPTSRPLLPADPVIAVGVKAEPKHPEVGACASVSHGEQIVAVVIRQPDLESLLELPNLRFGQRRVVCVHEWTPPVLIALGITIEARSS
jgi:hypothetical protein